MGAATTLALIGLPILLVAGFALAGEETPQAKPKVEGGPKPPSGGTKPLTQGTGPFVQKKTSGGKDYYYVNPSWRQSLIEHLRDSHVVQERDQGPTLAWTILSQATQNDGLIQNLYNWNESGYSILVDPALASEEEGTRSITLVKPGAGNPWVFTREDMAMLFAAPLWEDPSKLEPKPSAPGDALSELPAAAAVPVRALAEKGPLRAMASMADELDKGGYHNAADWMRSKMADRAITRKAASSGVGFWEYKLRKSGELPPYAFAEAYIGDGSKYIDIVKLTPGLAQTSSGVSGWMATKPVRLPPEWPDPETMDLPLGHGSNVGAAKQTSDANIQDAGPPIPQVDNPPDVGKSAAAAAKSVIRGVGSSGPKVSTEPVEPQQAPGTFKAEDPLFSLNIEPRNPIFDPRFQPDNPATWFD